MIILTPPTTKRFVSSTWGRPRAYRGGWHEGLDFPAAINSPVLAAAPGEVIKVDNVDNSFAGKYIVLHHGGGIHTRYLHNNANLVKVGDSVARGQVIAKAGATGTSGKGAPHVHFDMKLKPEAHAQYEALYGRPTTGWGRTMGSLGKGVPAETFMSGATYAPAALKWAQDVGVTFYSGGSLLKVAAVLGASYLGYRILK